MKKSILLAMTALGAAGTVHAAKIDFSKISAQANWVAHADFDALRTSEVGAFIIAQAKKTPEAAKGIATLKAIFGIDLDALSHFTAYGRGEPNKGIFSLKGGFDAERLQAMIELNESYSAQKHSGTVIHLFDKHQDDPKAVAFTAKDEIVGSPSSGHTKHGLDVTAGKAPSLEPKGIHKSLSGLIPYPIVLASVDVKGVAEFNKVAEGPEAVIIQKANSIGLEYLRATFHLGLGGYGAEGKTQGLAAYGDPTQFDAYMHEIEVTADGGVILSDQLKGQSSALATEGGYLNTQILTNRFLDNHGIRRIAPEPLTEDHNNLAASVQKMLEEVVEDKGVKVFVDPTALMYLIGAEMDWRESKFESGFVFNNPNETDRCGCGESFRI